MNEINCLNSKIIYFVNNFDVNLSNWPLPKKYTYYYLNFNDTVSIYDIRMVIHRKR